MKFIVAIVSIITVFLSQYVLADTSAREFFDRYILLSENFDLKVSELYSDNARILTYRKYPHGLQRAMEMSGAQWKQLLTKAIPLAKAQNDKSIYSKITISVYGNGYKIKADRYSNRKCYTDTNYYMLVAPNEHNELRIIEEYSVTQPQSNC